MVDRLGREHRTTAGPIFSPLSPHSPASDQSCGNVGRSCCAMESTGATTPREKSLLWQVVHWSHENGVDPWMFISCCISLLGLKCRVCCICVQSSGLIKIQLSGWKDRRELEVAGNHREHGFFNTILLFFFWNPGGHLQATHIWIRL